MAVTMLIRKCDICGTEIGGQPLDRESITVSVGGGLGVELCKTCAKPVIRFLQRSQLLEEQLERRGFIKTSAPRPASDGQQKKTSRHSSSTPM